MKDATLKQAGKILDLISQKETPSEQLQKLLGSGFLSDLLDANIEIIDRNAFRKVIGLMPLNVFSVMVDYDRLVENGVKVGNYNWKNDNITSKNFPSQETGKKEVSIELIHFNKRMETDEILKELNKKELRPATLKELLAFGEKYPDIQREFPIIALGSVWQRPSGGRGCPYLSRHGSGRSLVLCWFDVSWDGFCRFAVVCK